MIVADTPLIAVIDDDEASAFALSLLVEDWGYQAVSGTDARTIIDHLDAERGVRLSAIVTDFHLAEGDGVTAIAAIMKHQGRPCPAIVVTGSRGGGAARDAARQGYPVLSKPFEPERLHRLLARLLG